MTYLSSNTKIWPNEDSFSGALSHAKPQSCAVPWGNLHTRAQDPGTLDSPSQGALGLPPRTARQATNPSSSRAPRQVGSRLRRQVQGHNKTQAISS